MYEKINKNGTLGAGNLEHFKKIQENFMTGIVDYNEVQGYFWT